MQKEFKIINLEDTLKIAAQLAKVIAPPDVITLEGDLGAGKTTFTQALAKNLGITRTVSSPTFTILKQYEGKYPLNHLDVYRLEGSDEDLGWEELFYGDAITVIEWAQFIAEELPEDYLEIQITQQSADERTIIFKPKGARYEQICEEIEL